MNVCLVDLKNLLKGKKFRYIAIAIVAICVCRGLAYRYIWQFGSFLYGALYMFLLFVGISLIVLPMYILNKVYGEAKEQEEEQKSGSDGAAKGCLFSVAVVIGLVVAVLLLIIGFPVLADLFYFTEERVGLEQFVINIRFGYVYYFATLFLLLLLYWMKSKNGLFYVYDDTKRAFLCNLPRKVKIVTGTIAVLLWILSAVVCLTNYDAVGENTFIRQHFVSRTCYQYKDVDYSMLYCKLDGTLGYQITFEDGKHIVYYGDMAAEQLDAQKYPEGADDFVIEIAGRLAKEKVPLKIENEKKLYKRLHYDYWDTVAKKIIRISRVES